WSTFASFYKSLKGKIINVHSHVYAAQHNSYNGCIGNSENTESFLTVLQPYIAIVESNPGFIPGDALGQNNSNENSICGALASAYYADKIKRFIDSDYATDSGNPDAVGDQINSAQTNYFLQTGRCPLSYDMEAFLDGLLDTSYQNDGFLVEDFNAADMPFLTASVASAAGATAGNMPLTIDSELLPNGMLPANQLEITVAGGMAVRLVIINTPSTSCGTPYTPTWLDYQTGVFTITDIKNLTYVPGSYNAITGLYQFDAIMSFTRTSSTAQCDYPEEVRVHGYTPVAIGECGFSDNDPALHPGGTVLSNESGIAEVGCTKKDRFEKGLTLLFNRLENGNSPKIFNPAFSLNGLPNTLGIVPDPFGYRGSILPEVLGDTFITGQWSSSGQDTFYITSQGGTLAYIHFDAPVLPASIKKFTAAQITNDTFGHPVSLKLMYLDLSNQPMVINGVIYKNEQHQALDFSCLCTEPGSLQSAAEAQFLKLIKYVHVRRNTLNSSNSYQPQPLMAQIDPYLSIDSPSINNFTKIVG
ncbi:hypothetical protein VF13_42210, partial [Nostoc linckia z16]